MRLSFFAVATKAHPSTPNATIFSLSFSLFLLSVSPSLRIHIICPPRIVLVSFFYTFISTSSRYDLVVSFTPRTCLGAIHRNSSKSSRGIHVFASRYSRIQRFYIYRRTGIRKEAFLAWIIFVYADHFIRIFFHAFYAFRRKASVI